MNTSSIEWVDMFGPSVRDPRVVCNRKVAKRDVPAYEAAGFQLGSVKGAPDAADVPDPNAESAPAKGKGKGKSKADAE